PQFKVLRSVIAPVPVPMVNGLGRQQWTAEDLFHHRTVLFLRYAAHHLDLVALLIRARRLCVSIRGPAHARTEAAPGVLSPLLALVRNVCGAALNARARLAGLMAGAALPAFVRAVLPRAPGVGNRAILRDRVLFPAPNTDELYVSALSSRRPVARARA